jgi:hypothetical protein
VARPRDWRIEAGRIVGALLVFAYHYAGDSSVLAASDATRSIPWSLARYHAGPVGVAIFVVISGIGVALSVAARGSSIGDAPRRLSRVFGLYWWVAVPMLILALATGRLAVHDLWKVPLWLSGLGIVSAGTFYPVVDGWWYIALAAQIVLVAPVIARLAQRVGSGSTAVLAAALSYASMRLVSSLGATYMLQGFVGCWLFELSAGVAFGLALGGEYCGIRRRWLVDGAILLACGGVLGLLSPAQYVQRIVGIMVVASLLAIPRRRDRPMVLYVGGLTYAFFLAHSPWAKPILGALVAMRMPNAAVVGLPVSLAIAAAVGLAFQRSYDGAGRSIRSIRQRRAARLGADVS